MDNQDRLQKLIIEYRVIEKKIDSLAQQKQALREKLQTLMTQSGQTYHQTALDEERVIIKIVPRTEIRYDEALLRDRLGDQYRMVLEPDLKKIKSHLPQITPALEPYIEAIGSPSRDRIKDLITTGLLMKEDFKGAFRKIDKSIMFVKKRSLDEPSYESAPQSQS